MKHVPRQRGLWTPPPGVSTAVFGDSFEDFTQKSETVDMWTPFSLIILKATTVHQHPGGPESKTESSLSAGPCLRRWYIGGSPFTVHRSRFVSPASMVFGYGHIVLNYLRGSKMPLRRQSYAVSPWHVSAVWSLTRQPIFHSASVAFVRWCVWGHGLHTISSWAACSCMQCLTKKKVAFFSRTIGKMRRTKRGCETLWQQLLH